MVSGNAARLPSAPSCALGAPVTGFSLVEALLVLAVVALTTAVAVPILDEAQAAAEAAAAARYVAGSLAAIRFDAARRGRAVALRFDAGPPRSFTRYVDGNGDGVRAADVTAGVDPPLAPPDHLEDHFRGATFRLVWTVPAIDAAGTLTAGDDPVRIGAAEQLTFTPLGTATSGTLYVAGRRGHQYAIRVFGATGRTRVLRFDPGNGHVATVLSIGGERRQEARDAPLALGWDADAVLRPGRAVRIVDLSRGGALIESEHPVRPGSLTELQLVADGARAAVRARVARCWVDALAPLRYRARLVFNARLE